MLVDNNLKLASEFGGAEGTRTPDPFLAKEMLSRLSYSPMHLIEKYASFIIATKYSGFQSDQTQQSWSDVFVLLYQ
jgi:hypothetical protein